ncbi:hypothetical protein BDQ17DRAFT_1474525 [Cyathus striatus]|nr:hypothetical protein BDQ17DRAFT_1474525 [Cyathus striatus]
MTITPSNATANLNQWLETRTGPYSYGYANQLAWGRVRNVSSIFNNNTTQDPAAGPRTPHYQFVPHASPDILPTGEAILSLGLGVVTVSSRGCVSLNSNDPFDIPIIDPHI